MSETATEPDLREIDSERVEYRVEQTGAGHDALPPVTFCAQASIASFQDYLTPDQADQLADALKAHAAWARAGAAAA